MQRAKRWTGYLIALFVGALIVPLGAQALMQLTDGTFAGKAVIYDGNGNAIDWSALTISSNINSIEETVDVNVTNGSATDANSHAIVVGAATMDADAVGEECAFVTTAAVVEVACTSTATNFYGLEVFNTTTTVAYARLYNLADPTCSSSTGYYRTIPIPPAADTGQVGGAVRIGPYPTHRFSTAFSVCITGGGSSTDNTATVAGIYGAFFAKGT